MDVISIDELGIDISYGLWGGLSYQSGWSSLLDEVYETAMKPLVRKRRGKFSGYPLRYLVSTIHTLRRYRMTEARQTGYITDWGTEGNTAIGVVTPAHITFWEKMTTEQVRTAERIAFGHLRLITGDHPPDFAQQLFEEETQFVRTLRQEYRIPDMDLVKWDHISGSLWGIRIAENLGN